MLYRVRASTPRSGSLNGMSNNEKPLMEGSFSKPLSTKQNAWYQDRPWRYSGVKTRLLTLTRIAQGD